MAFRSSISGSTSNGSAGVTVNPPAGAQVGDMLISVAVFQSTSVTAPSGFTAIGSEQLIKDAGGVSTYDRMDAFSYLYAGESSFTFTTPSATTLLVAIVALSGRNTGAPVTAIAGAQNGASQQTIVCPAVTAASNDDLVCFAGNHDVTTMSSGPAAMTLDVNTSQALGGGGCLASAYANNIASGTTGTKTFTETQGSAWYRGAGFTIAVAVAAAPPAHSKPVILSGTLKSGGSDLGVSGAYWSNTGPYVDSECWAIIGTATPAGRTMALRLRSRNVARSGAPAIDDWSGITLHIINNSLNVYSWDGTTLVLLGSYSVTCATNDKVGLRIVGTSWELLRQASGGATVSLATGPVPAGYIDGWLGFETNSNTAAIKSFGGGNPNIAGPPLNTVAPVVSGTATIGQTLTSTTGTWTNSPTGYTYQWQRDNAGNGVFGNIAGATASTRVVAALDAGSQLRCVVTAVNASGSASANSNAVTATPSILNITPPAISGTAKQGLTLSCSTGTWAPTPISYSYQWQRDTAGNGVYSNIGAATSSTYVLAAGDVGAHVRCQVTANA